MAYLGTQPNDVKQNKGLYTPSEILQLTKDGSWGGSLELIAEQTVSNVTYADFTSIKENVFDVHYLTIENYQNSTNADDVIVQLFESGTIEDASVYRNAYQECSSSNRFNEYKSTGDNNLFSLSTSGDSASRSGNGYMYLYNAGNSSKYTFGSFQSVGDYTTILGHAVVFFGGGYLPQTSTVDGIRIKSLYHTSTASFTAKLYGVKEI